MRFKRS